MSNKIPYTKRPVPPKFKHVIQAEFYRAFTWTERLQILLGYRSIISVHITVEQKPGMFDPKMTFRTTKEILNQEPKETT